MSELSAQVFNNAPAKGSATVTSNGANQVILGPMDIQGYSNLGFYVHNSLGGGDDLAAVTLQTAPERSGPWVDAQEIASAVPAGDATFYSYADACLKYARVVAACAAGETTVATVWLCASQRG